MLRRYLKINERIMQRFGDQWRFQVRGNGVLFEQLCPNHELDQVKMDEINNQFRNSLRYLKHHAGYFDETAAPKDIAKAMEKWSSTNEGIAIKVADDPVKEFSPFTL